LSEQFLNNSVITVNQVIEFKRIYRTTKITLVIRLAMTPLRSRNYVCVLALTLIYHRARLEYAQIYVQWTAQQWSNL